METREKTSFFYLKNLHLRAMLRSHLPKFNQQVLEKAEGADTEEKQQELLSFLRHGASALIKMYPQDFNSLLEEKKIKAKFDHLQEVAQIMDSELASYKIDDTTGKMSIKLQDQVIIQESLFDVGQFIETRLKIKKEDEAFYLLLGFFSEPKNYELAQFFETAVKISE